MTTATTPQTMPMTTDLDIKPVVQSMIASHAAFWTPRHVWGSRDLKYIPYLFWLVESALPRRIVQIGLDDGVTFLSLCQAVDKLRLDASCVGLYLERDERLSHDFLNIQTGFYADISCLERFKPDAISNSTNPAEIDMLVLGRAVSDDVLAELRTELLPQLNDGATIILLNASGSSKSANAEGIMRALREKCTVISALDDAEAPVVLIKGSPGSERLRRMSDITARSPEHLLLRQIFLRLGQGIEDAELARQRKRALEVVQGKTDQLTQTLEAYETQIASLRADVKSRRTIEETHLEKIAIQTNQLTQLQSDATSQSAEIETLREKLTEAQEKRQAFYARSAELQAERDKLLSTVDERYMDIAILSSDAESRISRLEKELKIEKSRFKKLMQSSSWRYTAPLRKIKNMM